jgi:hypothetical protein
MKCPTDEDGDGTHRTADEVWFSAFWFYAVLPYAQLTLSG